MNEETQMTMHSFLLKFLTSKNIKQNYIFLKLKISFLRKLFIDTISKANIDIEIHKTPMFIFDRDKFKTMAKGKESI